MKHFNFERAWKELMIPAFEALPANVRELLWTVDNCCQFGQSADLDMAFPSEEMMLADREQFDHLSIDDWDRAAFLYHSFNEAPAEILAKAARVVHNFGHWAPSCKTQESLFNGYDLNFKKIGAMAQRHGAHWKFSNYADQILTIKLGWERDRSCSKRGLSFAVHEGAIRACFSTYQSWTWQEIGFATAKTWKQIQKVCVPVEFSFDELIPENRRLDAWDRYVEQLKEACKDEDFNRLTDLSSYMEEE